MYFSATGTTKKIVSKLANDLSRQFNYRTTSLIDFTLPQARKETISFKSDDLVIIGVPVYAGRVPNVLLNYLNTIKSEGALAAVVVVYGNRNYDDALIELKDILELNGFDVVAAGAFIGEHSFSDILAKGRPDENDLNVACDFAKQIHEKLLTKNNSKVNIPGSLPYRAYYKPRNKQGVSVDIRKVIPKTNDNCTDCKLCALACPMGSIEYEDVTKLKGICIKCGVCIKICHVNAKYYDDENYLTHKNELEIEFARRREPEIFL